MILLEDSTINDSKNMENSRFRMLRNKNKGIWTQIGKFLFIPYN